MSSNISIQTKKLFDKVKKSVDQNIGRNEASRGLSDELQKGEARVKQLEKVLKQSKKRVAAGQASAVGTDNDRRLQKLPEYTLAQALFEMTNQLAGSELLLTSNVYRIAGEAQYNLAKSHLQLELDVEEHFLTPVHSALDSEFPVVKRFTKQLEEMTSDRDTALHRLQTARRQQQSDKEKTLQEEVDVWEQRLENTRDQLATNLHGLISREPDFSQRMIDFLKAQCRHYERAVTALQQVLPILDAKLTDYSAAPVFGQALEEHLERTGRSISVVVEMCICKLMEDGLEEEGLLRIAGGASRLKKLRAAFDASSVDMNEFATDIHAVAGVLKQYLRELPEPLLTFDLYDEWIATSQLQGDARLQAMWVATRKLPKSRYEHLRYLVKFLAAVAERSEVNKMTASNLAIVVGPNLLWRAGDQGLDVLKSQKLGSIVESLIQHADWFFPEKVVFAASESAAKSKANSSEAETLWVQNNDTDKNPRLQHTDSQQALLNVGSGAQLKRKKAAPGPPRPVRPAEPRLQPDSQLTTSNDGYQQRSSKPATADKPAVFKDKPALKPGVSGDKPSERSDVEKPRPGPSRPPAPTASELAAGESIRIQQQAVISLLARDRARQDSPSAVFQPTK